MIRFINSFLKRFGVQVKRSQSLIAERAYYEGIINGAKELNKIREEHTPGSLNNKVAGLAFSRDRPLQLHALLSSYFKLVANAVPVDIIYKASSEQVENYYQELAAEFSGYPILLIKENSFYRQVIHWLENNDANRIFFLTDDAIFLEEMDIHDCLSFEPIDDIFCFKNGNDFDYSFVYDKIQELPTIEIVNIDNKKNFLKWKWKEKKDSPGWNYPLSVDGNIFYRKEILSICKNIAFKSPNSLEAGMQVYNDFFLGRNGISYSKVKMVNVPCNLVQNEFANRSTGLFTIEELLNFWNDGKRIDVDEFYRLTANEAMHKKFNFFQEK